MFVESQSHRLHARINDLDINNNQTLNTVIFRFF